MRTELLNETSLYVTDLGAAERFYENAIGLEVCRRMGGLRSTLRHDDFTLVLFESEGTPLTTLEPSLISIGIAPAELDPWRERLQRREVPIEREVAWPDGTHSLVCRDPDGNRVELKTQLHHELGVAEGERMAQTISKGLNAEWKLFQAANLGLAGSQTQP